MIGHVQKMCQNPDTDAIQNGRFEGEDSWVQVRIANENVSTNIGRHSFAADFYRR